MILFLVVSSGRYFCQSNYQGTLQARLDQIRELKNYNNTIVINVIDSVNYHNLSFPYWSADSKYYAYDIVRYKYCQYEALADSTLGDRPDISRTIWNLISGPHPFLFLRDTVTSEDLKNLLLDKHPYVKTYAFAALSYRKSDNLLSVIVDNLADTTKMDEFTGDVGDWAYPADMMIQYETYRLSKADKKKLKDLITTKYRHLERSLMTLNGKRTLRIK
jgi:hypothetical protein